MVLLVVLAVQVLPYSLAQHDLDLTEFSDYWETESDENDTEEEKRIAEDADSLKDDDGYLFVSSFHYLYEFPIPLYLETLIPPPDVT